MSGEPNTARAGVEPSSSLAAALRPRRTHGRWSTQFAAAQWARRASFRGQWNHPDGLWVVGSRLAVLDVEQAAEGGPQGGGELGPVV
jgi:hypothetical protein